MFVIAYFKDTKKIYTSRYNDSVGVQIPTAQEWLQDFCDNNALDVNDFVAIELPYDKNLSIVVGNHFYNEATGKIEADPDYTPPPQPTTPPEGITV